MSFLKTETPPAWRNEDPIRSEVFGEDRLREHATSLAESHQLSSRGWSRRNLFKRVRADYALLKQAHAEVLGAIAREEPITPAAEWLADNFYSISQHALQVQEDLPRDYYQRLPKLANGHLEMCPRIMAVAWAYIAHTDSHFNANTLAEFVTAYQKVSPLALGELWATPIYLRILLIDNAARIARRTFISMQARRAATDLAIEFGGQTSTLDAARAALEKLEDHAKRSFLVQLLSAARAHHGLTSEAVDELRSLYDHTPFDHAVAVQEEHGRQTANNLSMQNIFTSLKRISEQDWVKWIESVSAVDQKLGTSAGYKTCDSATRTSYRRAVEELAHYSGTPEGDVTDAAIHLAGSDDIGAVLIGAGRPGLEKHIRYNLPAHQRLYRIFARSGVIGYAAATGVATFVLLYLGYETIGRVALPLGLVALMLFALLAPVFEAAMAMINFAVTQLVRPVVLPSLSFENGIPAAHRSIIAVPILLGSHHGIETQLARLEEHYLSNADPELSYAIISDWRDAPAEQHADDTALLSAVTDGIAALNDKYQIQQFMLFHRRRQWNPAQGVWMGWERKRGKLHEFNRVLRGAEDTPFISVPAALPQDIKYVIVLDADTILPRGAARRLVGKMAHPLNQPHVNPVTNRVDRGYGIIQPRVTISLPEFGKGSWYQRILAVGAGVDPYVTATSDVYQDLFGEGSFTGKGIYHIDAFEAAMRGRIPDNTLLSHDLFEGNLARAALATDVEVVEDYPERYLVDLSRQHRWVRGDWQLLPWMIPPDKALSTLGLWKMFDNLRRSVTPAFTLLAFALGVWILPGNAASTWTFFIVALLFFPSLLSIFAGTSFRQEATTVASQLRTLRDDTRHALVLTITKLFLLANQAVSMLDAVLRTLYRLFVSHRYLLEWTTAAQAQSGPRPTLASTYRAMALSAILATLLPLGQATVQGHVGGLSLFLAGLWVLAPAFAYFISLPPEDPAKAVTAADDVQELRLIALRTWRFFETHVNAQENFLPPDNVQEDPKLVVAHRTSPTNIGLYLLATVAVCEAGWIGRAEAARKLTETLDTTERLPRHKGHLYNWYDTETLAPLPPRYVSTVDSGNLAGHCIAVANALETWAEDATLKPENLDGFDDLMLLVREQVKDAARLHRKAVPAARDIGRALTAARSVVAEMRSAPELASLRIIGLIVQLRTIETSIKRLWEAAPPQDKAAGLFWLERLITRAEAIYADAIVAGAQRDALFASLTSLAQRCRAFANGMDFGFLLNRQRQLLSIGYRVEDEVLDENCYDLLASEASLTSFFAIAKNDADVRHWTRLGRPVVPVDGAACLVSWSGSMFEYLMPLLVLRPREGTLLNQTMSLSVERQKEYAKELGTPWGISESAFAARDRAFTYQYSAFGVPGLGLKRGLSANHVIAPYATGLAAMVDPAGAAENYRNLAKLGAAGRYGYYESIDFTPQRLRKGESHELVRAYFAHHQAMSICGICNAVLNGTLRDHFHREASVRASELLLQERAPHYLPSRVTVLDQVPAAKVKMAADDEPARVFAINDVSRPVTHLLSNGNYSVMLTATGTGWSRWQGIAINRWREDPTRDADGMALNFDVLESGAHWTLDAPTASQGARALAIFSPEKAEFQRSDDGVGTHIECMVASEDDAEARVIHLTNTTSQSKTLALTSYMELALARPDADDAHPAFSKMFVRTEFVPGLQALIATRRKRQDSDQEIWVAQFIVTNTDDGAAIEYETSREAFLSRGNSLENARMLAGRAKFASTVGDVLDPVFALRRHVKLKPHRKSTCVLWTIAAPSRESLLEKVSRYRVFAAMERVQVTAWTQSRILLRHLGTSTDEARLFQDLASLLIYASPMLRPAPDVIRSGMGRQGLLWSVGISGTNPLVLVEIEDQEHMPLAKQILEARNFWLEMGLTVDLVIFNTQAASYDQQLGNALQDMVAKADVGRSPHGGVEPGSITLLRTDVTAPDVITAVRSAASVNLRSGAGSLEQQVTSALAQPAAHKRHRILLPAISPSQTIAPSAPRPEPAQFFNGFGGFSAEGDEYVIHHRADEALPAPWINVIANPKFGMHASAEGGGYIWFKNSRERQVTPWSNDAVGDPPSEAFYVRNQSTGALSSPTVLPLGRRAGVFKTRHGFGYTIHEAEENGLHLSLSHTIACDDAVKLSQLSVGNLTNQAVKLRITAYADVVLGQKRSASARFVTSEKDSGTGALFLRNKFNPDFGDAVLFADFSGAQSSASGNRLNVLGWKGDTSRPAMIESGSALDDSFGGGLDPCAALSFEVEIPRGETRDFTLLMGVGENTDDAAKLITQYRATGFAAALAAQKAQWQTLAGSLKIKTPEPAFDIMMNGWLMYQVISCRFWGRSGFYQASGAFGFRDQLQDSLSIAQVRPDLTRHHILLAASRQFAEGDVQHWWLQETGAGVRTHISDDTVWLAYLVCKYLQLTGDQSILDEKVAWLEGPQVDPGKHDNFFVPRVSANTDTLYEHCVRALKRNLPTGSHGLPLMGTGDWNDGMNQVGEAGRGESVWLAWFLCFTLEQFEAVSRQRNDAASADMWASHRAALAKALDGPAWDGAWYKRAFFDDGSPLGTHADDECQIDSIAQSWAVISHAGDPARARQAVDSAKERLVDFKDQVASLFWPPLQHHKPSAGYVQSYPAGVRENGGQYTHGALWMVFALSELGRPDDALQLLQMINPVNHASSPELAKRYKVEPYVIAADVYGVAPHRGRGGWTWYTGAAGWAYRAGLEAILGLERKGSMLQVSPRVPESWNDFTAEYSFQGKRITLQLSRGSKSAKPKMIDLAKVKPGEVIKISY
ncbi:GH36-type glycosyl hydrolase domain-containing protein [Aestuariivirga litoralis]|uniref:GH36-type glycosyl hydrolase domain-containing protein n=1 Tax=Aestuariivirga litoralis TaxID=2650924 RepID=UPI0018C7FB33|nr:glucoamylase family protein [Aestuariivirga litoralis]